MVQLSHPYMSAGKTIALTRWNIFGKVMFLLFNMPSRLVITFLPRSYCLLISWLQSPSAIISEPQKIKSLTVSTVSQSICYEVMGPDAMILVFWMLSFKSTFSLSSFTFIKRLFSSSSLSAIGWCHLHTWGYRYFSQQPWFQPVFHPASVSHDVFCIEVKWAGWQYTARHTPFPIWKEFVVSCPVLIAVSWSAYRFLKRQVR